MGLKGEKGERTKMGSLEEEKLFQMVHDFIEPESTSENPSYSSQNLSLNNHHAKQYILQVFCFPLFHFKFLDHSFLCMC